jgi:hypothetical protein
VRLLSTTAPPVERIAGMTPPPFSTRCITFTA